MFACPTTPQVMRDNGNVVLDMDQLKRMVEEDEQQAPGGRPLLGLSSVVVWAFYVFFKRAAPFRAMSWIAYCFRAQCTDTQPQ